jgi:phage baseplate assembly protein W
MATTRVLSNQDTNQNTSAIITSRSRVYRDIDLSFTAKPNGELYVKRDAAAVTQALKNLIQTNYFEKPFQPFFGGNIRAMLFELVDEDSEEELAEQIVKAINAYEPRAKLLHLDVDVEPDQNTLRVKIEYQVVNTEEVVTFTTSVSRLR